MLGRAVHDPQGIEGEAGWSRGFGLLEVETTLMPDKRLRRTHGRLAFADARVSGYEIHAGITRGDGLAGTVAQLETGTDGARSDDDRVLGTYLHGLFEEPGAMAALLRWAGLAQPGAAPDHAALREAGIDRLADACEAHLDLDSLLAPAGAGRDPGTACAR